MKKKEIKKELAGKSEAELHRMLAEHREKTRDMRFKVSQKQLKNIREIRDVKKMIARVVTSLRAKKN